VLPVITPSPSFFTVFIWAFPRLFLSLQQNPDIMKTNQLFITLVLSIIMLALPAPSLAQKPGTFTTGDKTFLLNGKPFVVKAAEIHYPRIPRPYWEHRIRMCKALGMNTVCIYIFWNIHEQREGQFDFTGNNDVAEFCRLAQKNGLYVIVRPGPYVCAEWEMGGLPWWLLKKKDIRLRERDPYFMERVKIFEEKVGEQLRPLTIQRGGPIIMMQVENEYGSYGEDKPYVSEIRDCLRSIYGEELSLFQCDWASNFTKNGLDDLTWTMNFGTGANIDQQFRRLGELRPNAPKMCSEFWSGWFDKWGARHETRPAKDMVDGMDEMLSKGISFSLYMTHGGTSFGHWAGANSPGFAPDVTSYDYDAPINEYGHTTPKFFELRNMMEKYSLSPDPSPKGKGKKVALPAVPKAPMPIITVPKFQLTEFAPLMYANGGLNTDGNADDLTFEAHNLGWGYAAYYTTLPELPLSSVLTADFHDFAQVFVDGKYIGKIDRVKNEKSLTLPPAKAGSSLVIVVEAMGRINFGRAIKDFKGIVGNVTISTQAGRHDVTYTLNGWEKYFIDDAYETALLALKRASATDNNEYIEHFKDDAKMMGGRGYYRGYFSLKKVGDTFLNFETWGKGQVYVNGHAMGRIWSIGPQQTLYVPGCWLKKGRNEVIVLDIVGPREAAVWGQAEPELNKLNIEKTVKHNNIGDKPDLNSMTPAAAGQLNAGNGWQTIRFQTPQRGRYVALQCLSNHDGTQRTCIAELYLQNASGSRLSREPWTVKYANSENENGNHLGDKVYDLQESTFWQTERSATLPHLLVIDLGSEQTVTALEYLPRAEEGAPGAVKDFKVFVY
jgi:beta-galactosidase